MTIPTPLSLHRDQVKAGWIDFNGHMNVAYYVLAFDYATDAFFEYLGLTTDYRHQERITTFAVEAHITYQREVMEGDGLRFTTQLIGYDDKRIHYFHRMFQDREDYLAATWESMSLAVDSDQRRVRSFPAAIIERISEVHSSHASLPRPGALGSVIDVKRRKK